MMNEIEHEIARTRLEIERTLAAIEDKFDIPKQTKKVGRKAQASFQKNPTAWIVSAAVVVVGVAGLVTLFVRRGK